MDLTHIPIILTHVSSSSSSIPEHTSLDVSSELPSNHAHDHTSNTTDLELSPQEHDMTSSTSLPIEDDHSATLLHFRSKLCLRPWHILRKGNNNQLESNWSDKDRRNKVVRSNKEADQVMVTIPNIVDHESNLRSCIETQSCQNGECNATTCQTAVSMIRTTSADMAVVVHGECLFLSHDLSLLESLEFKQRIKHIVDIIKEVNWEDIDPDMLTSKFLSDIVMLVSSSMAVHDRSLQKSAGEMNAGLLEDMANTNLALPGLRSYPFPFNLSMESGYCKFGLYKVDENCVFYITDLSHAMVNLHPACPGHILFLSFLVFLVPLSTLDSRAPQLLILEHKASCAYVIHCGENSIIEGCSSGVPLLTWPLFAEQFVNEKLVTQVLKLGVSVSTQPSATFGSETVKSERIEEAINRVMEGEEAKKIRTKVKEFGDSAKNAVERGGSSYKDLKAMTEELKYDLLESLEFKRRIKQIVDIIEDVKWEDIDPDMPTSCSTFFSDIVVCLIFDGGARPRNQLGEMNAGLLEDVACMNLALPDREYQNEWVMTFINGSDPDEELEEKRSQNLLTVVEELIYTLSFEVSNVWSSFGGSLKVVIDWFIFWYGSRNMCSNLCKVVVHGECLFLSHDLSLLESLEFKQRIKHIVDIIKEVNWEDIDPDMLTSKFLSDIVMLVSSSMAVHDRSLQKSAGEMNAGLLEDMANSNLALPGLRFGGRTRRDAISHHKQLQLHLHMYSEPIKRASACHSLGDYFSEYGHPQPLNHSHSKPPAKIQSLTLTSGSSEYKELIDALSFELAYVVAKFFDVWRYAFGGSLKVVIDWFIFRYSLRDMRTNLCKLLLRY
ncbi:UDP-glucuronosyl/UDP-glucosyltransferase [Dillenia turbinata]|uniref:UDP-glucuronosyl/UDP-glucosyltransferase n=1 Tax=Dillenia turbinata TaxID=194707 RepID=A0AAN8UTS3_9MAGN